MDMTEVLVVGGGSTGCGIVRDLAMRGEIGRAHV